MMFIEPGSRTIVTNEPDEGGRLEQVTEGVYQSALPENVGIANTAQEWSGKRWTSVIWPLPSDAADRSRLLVHELFHRIQPELGLELSNPPNGHLDKRDGRVWMRLEWRALARALGSEGATRKQAIADALSFRAQRRSLFDNAAEQERQLELNEGLAEYTGLRIAASNPSEAMRRAAVALGDAEKNQTFTRAFAYASGPAYGLLLDDARPDWRAEVARRPDLGGLLGSAIGHAPPTDPDKSVAEAASRYGADEITIAEDERWQRHRRQIAEATARFVDGPVLVLPIVGDMRYTFDPRGVMALEGHGQVHQRVTVRDTWGRLEVQSGGALLMRDADGKMLSWRVPVTANVTGAPMHGDGWELMLNNGWRLEPVQNASYTVVGE